MATYKCPRCGTDCLTPNDAAKHCLAWKITYEGYKPGKRTCPDCNGTGQCATLFGPNMPCERCGGLGKID